MIYCFSGTGNSRYVARTLATLLGEDIIEIGSSPAASVPVGDDGLTVWVFPIHSWGLPKVVERFVESQPRIGGRHYMVCTCGDDAGLAHEQWRGLIRRYHGRPQGTFSVTMPNTYVALPGFDVDAPAVEEEKLAQAEARVRDIASRIAGGWQGDDVVKGSIPWIKTRLVYPAFMSLLTSPRRFRVDTDRCIGCGRCVAQCPLSNVMLDSSRHPVWGDDCTLCLGCYHACPEHAVEYGRETQKKGQYLCPLR